MSPEQATGDRDVDPRSDMYALGCVLYEMLSGQPPFSASTAQAVLVKILTVDAPSITSERRTVPPHVGHALARALEKLPADRFTNAAEFGAALADPGFTYEARGSDIRNGLDPGDGSHASTGHDAWPLEAPDDSNDDTRGPPCCPGRLGLAPVSSGPRAGCANAGGSDGRRPSVRW